jgi:thiol-disulfide isomerase/thioredoxin
MLLSRAFDRVFNHIFSRVALPLLVMLGLLLSGLLSGVGIAPAFASLTDDNFDGNIFALYAGNGSLVPAKITLAMSMEQHRSSVVMFFLDDSRDCKMFASVFSQLQSPYGRQADFIPVNVDTIDANETYPTTDPRHYYRGQIPQILVFDQQGKLALDDVGQVQYEAIDDVMRKIFDLLPRDESETLKRRQFNEVNAEFVKR